MKDNDSLKSNGSTKNMLNFGTILLSIFTVMILDSAIAYHESTRKSEILFCFVFLFFFFSWFR